MEACVSLDKVIMPREMRRAEVTRQVPIEKTYQNPDECLCDPKESVLWLDLCLQLCAAPYFFQAPQAYSGSASVYISAVI